jgi:mono/diheme cytochrome c family protein
MFRKLAVIGVALLIQASASSQTQPAGTTGSSSVKPGSFDQEIQRHAQQMIEEGRKIFRFDTFGDEAFWGDQLQLHQAIAGAKLGGVGPGLSPAKALELGLKIDSDSVPAEIAAGLKAGKVDLNDSANTIALLKANAVIGVTAFADANGNVRSMGIQCALCHSTVDDSFAPGIGRRRDGWPNRDLNVGAIVALAPNLKPYTDLLGVDEATVKKVLMSWGPGRYDAELDKDGKAFGPNGANASTVLPAAFGLAGVNLHTYSGWGSVTYWNAYVANTQMHGKGTFFDPRLRNGNKFPLSAKHRFDNIRHSPDLITPKLAALHFYQLSIPAPKPPAGSFDQAAAGRGEAVFNGAARCATCHVPPLFTEPGWSMHAASEIGIDDFQSRRSPDDMYRTTPLRGLFTREKGGFYHDGRFKTLDQVVQHYEKTFELTLTDLQKRDLVQYLRSL